MAALYESRKKAFVLLSYQNKSGSVSEQLRMAFQMQDLSGCWITKLVFCRIPRLILHRK